MKLNDWIEYNKYLFTDGDLRFLIKSIFAGDAVHARQAMLDEHTFMYLESIRDGYQEGIPMAYLLEKEEFFGLELEVNPNVLIPRKETELIVEAAIAVIQASECRQILEVGCGSGNISIAIKKAFPYVYMNASDKSIEAIKVARKNALTHNADIFFSCNDLLTGFRPASFDMVISNPPYVAAEDITGSLVHEPRMALEAKRDGFSLIERIMRDAAQLLRPSGSLVLEFGYNHKESVHNVVSELGCYDISEWIKDYDGNWRGVVLQQRA